MPSLIPLDIANMGRLFGALTSQAFASSSMALLRQFFVLLYLRTFFSFSEGLVFWVSPRGSSVYRIALRFMEVLPSMGYGHLTLGAEFGSGCGCRVSKLIMIGYP